MALETLVGVILKKMKIIFIYNHFLCCKIPKECICNSFNIGDDINIVETTSTQHYTRAEQSRFLKQKMLENDKMRVKQLRRFDVETTQKNRQGELINISSTLKVESTSKFPRRIDVIISTCIRLLKSIKSQRTFHVEFRWRINKDVSIGITPIFYVFN